jgi:hypothetical protein
MHTSEGRCHCGAVRFRVVGVAQHHFGGRCGIHSFSVPRSDPDKIDVSVRCLDGARPAGDAPGMARAPGQGGDGHAAGAGVFGCPTNNPGRSCVAVEGGLPLTLAGAAAHQAKGPRKRSTATLPCRGSSSV